ncbi:flagellum-specific ATP synthase FliI, partial [Burkholderia multivorans]
MVTPHTPESLAHGAMTPLERELARASRGSDALDETHDTHETHDTADAHAAPAADRAAQRTSSAPDARRAPHNPHLAHWREHLHALSARSQRALPLRPCGRLTRAAGHVLEAIGLRLSVGAECTIELPPGSTLPYVEAEVVGFSGERLFLM